MPITKREFNGAYNKFMKQIENAHKENSQK